MGDGQLEALAERAASGDSAALSRLVEEVQHPIYRLALRFLGHPEDAKDASQEILVRLVTNLGSFESRSQFMTWAYTVAIRQLTRTRKRQVESSVKDAKTFAAFLDRGLADRDFTAEEAESRLLCAEVRISCTYGMLLCLSRPLRASYILGDAMGLPDTIAAEICEITHAAQRQRLARARRTIRHIIADRCGLVGASSPCPIERPPDRRRVGARQSSSRARDPWPPPSVDVSSRVEPWTFCAGSRRPSHRSPIRKWFGEPPGIGPNRGAFSSGPSGVERLQFAGKKRRTMPSQVLFAMQKVAGSTPTGHGRPLRRQNGGFWGRYWGQRFTTDAMRREP
jgi:RNA polymerase sigma factor (sigma-70 family)